MVVFFSSITPKLIASSTFVARVITLREHINVFDLKTWIVLFSARNVRTVLTLGVMHFCNLIICCHLRDSRHLHAPPFRRSTTLDFSS